MNSGNEMVRVCVMIPANLVREIDEYARKLKAQNPTLRVSRSDAYRLLLSNALREEA